MKYLYNGLGFLSLFLGIIGAFLPILPTTPFIILSAFCFKNGSKQMHDWLLRQKFIGEGLNDWNNARVIKVKSKVLATFMIIVGIGSSIYFKVSFLWLQIILIIFSVFLITFILKQKSA